MSEIRRLRFLVELARQGTITAVAASTSSSTSAISQQLERLERDVGVPLVEPDGRRLTFTAAGRALLEHADQVLEAWESSRAHARSAAGSVRGTVRLAVFQTAFLSLVPTVIDRLGEDHPDLELVIAQAEPEAAMPAILARDLDLALVERYPGTHPPRFGHFDEYPLGDDPMMLATAASDRRPPALADLSDAVWVFEPTGSLARLWAESTCRTAGFEPRIAYETSDIVTQLDLVRRGYAAAFVSGLTPGGFRDGVRLDALGDVHERSISAVGRSRSDRDPSLAAVVGALRDASRGVLADSRQASGRT